MQVMGLFELHVRMHMILSNPKANISFTLRAPSTHTHTHAHTNTRAHKFACTHTRAHMHMRTDAGVRLVVLAQLCGFCQKSLRLLAGMALLPDLSPLAFRASGVGRAIWLLPKNPQPCGRAGSGRGSCAGHGGPAHAALVLCGGHESVCRGQGATC
jgi:hypothetical protein